MNFSKAVSAVLLLVSASVVYSQKLDKPFTTWSKEDAIKIVSDSPWAKPYQSTKGGAQAASAQAIREQGQSASRGGSNPRSVSRDFGPPPVTARLHSGAPLRQAMVRLQQLQVGYDKMSDGDKASFDQSRKVYLDCAICKDFYVVTVIKAVDSTGTLADEGVFQGFTSSDMKGNVKLVNDKGQVRELVEFTPPKSSRDAAIFFFKRNDDSGNPLITKDTRDFKLVFAPEFLDSRNRFAYLLPNTFEFKVPKLIVGDKLLF